MRVVVLGLVFAASGWSQMVDALKQLKNGSVVDVRQYAWGLTSGRGVSASLETTGSKTFTFTKCPEGVFGPSTWHRLRISGGVGTAEVLTVTGGTCGVGGGPGTITATTVNVHTGSWVIGTATGGIQEAVRFLEVMTPNGGSAILPRGNLFVYGTTKFLGVPAVNLMGQGLWSTNIILDSTFTSGDVFFCENSSCLAGFQDFQIGAAGAHGAGAGIHIKDNTGGVSFIKNVRVVDVYGGFWIDNSDYVTILQGNTGQDSNVLCKYGILVSGSSGDVGIYGGNYSAPEVNSADMTDYGVWITGADGLTIQGIRARGEYGIYIVPETGDSVGTVLVHGSIIDTCRYNNVVISTAGVPVLFTNIFFEENHIVTKPIMEYADAVYIDLTNMGTQRGGITFANNLIANANKNGFFARGVNTLVLTGNSFGNNNNLDVPLGGSGVRLENCDACTIVGNISEDTKGSPKQEYGFVLGGTLNGSTISSNIAKGNLSGGWNNIATTTNSLASGNIGLDDVRPLVAVSGTISVATLAKQYLLSGTGTINTINGMLGAGDSRRFYCPSGVTFGTGGNIMNGIGPTTANQVVTATYDAVDAKWRLN